MSVTDDISAPKQSSTNLETEITYALFSEHERKGEISRVNLCKLINTLLDNPYVIKDASKYKTCKNPLVKIQDTDSTRCNIVAEDPGRRNGKGVAGGRSGSVYAIMEKCGVGN